MDYQERMSLAASAVNGFLSRFQRPTHLDDQAAAQEIRDIAEEINAVISTSLSREGFRDRIEKALRHLRKGYTQRTWPTVAHFLKAMDQTHDRSAPVSSADKLALDPMQLAADRINAGEDVGDFWLFGRGYAEIVAAGLVTREAVRRYRSAMYFAAKDVAGEAYARSLEEKWLARPEATK